MRNLLKNAIPFLVLGLFFLMVALLPELFGGGLKDWCERKLGVNWPIIVLVLFLLVAMVAIKYKPDLLGDLLPNKKANGTPPKPEDISDFYPKIKEYLGSRYQSRIDQKLAWRQPVNLRRVYSTYGTSEEAVMAFVPFTTGEVQGEMSKTFQEAKGRLLLIGEPGTGKTSLLLQLVLDLLETEKDTLPVIVNLATWKETYADLATWLLEILPAELSVNKPLASQILLDNRLILLFDGLDEVKKEAHKSCMEAIGKYGKQGKRQFVITSRKEEYKMVEKDAPVNLQIEAGPLTIEQVEKSFAAMGHDEPEAVRLFFALQEDPLLRGAVQTPFYLNAMQSMFADGNTLKDFAFTAQDLEGRKQEIVERFVGDALQTPSKQANDTEAAKRWLGFLASRMTRNNKVVFELVDLQYDWWVWGRFNKKLFLFEENLVMLLPVFLIFGAEFSFIRKIGMGASSSILDGLIVVATPLIMFSFIALFFNIDARITTKDKRKISRSTFKIFLLISFVISYCLGLLIFIFTTSIGDLGISFKYSITYSLCFFIALLLYLIFTYNSYSLVQPTSPFHRFTESIKFLHFSILQHTHLCWLLARRGLLPRNLVAFLNEMTERHILESDGAIFDANGKITKSGATWRFRHRILQEYFAEQWKEMGKEN